MIYSAEQEQNRRMRERSIYDENFHEACGVQRSYLVNDQQATT